MIVKDKITKFVKDHCKEHILCIGCPLKEGVCNLLSSAVNINGCSPFTSIEDLNYFLRMEIDRNGEIIN